MNQRKRNAFTLVELLVVIAIIGILIGILLPAIQLAREAGRKMACKSRIGQVGLATLNYEMSTGHFPVGSIEPSEGPVENTPEGKHIGWIVQTLPYLGEGVMAKHFDMELGAHAAGNDSVRIIAPAIFDCPSYCRRHTDPDGFGPCTNYAACHNDTESPIDEDNTGMMFKNVPVRELDVSDGLANTILLGEKRIDKAELGWVSGTRATLRNTGTSLEEETMSWNSETTSDTPFEWTNLSSYDEWGEYVEAPEEDGATDVDPAKPTLEFTVNEDPEIRRYVGGFGSDHPSVVNVFMADGSVYSLDKRMNPEILKQLGHRSDGKLLTGGPNRNDWQDTEHDY